MPDVLFGLYDYPETQNHPAFNLILRVNFVSGAKENSGFRFTGSKAIMNVGGNVTLSEPPPETEPGYSIGTFSEAGQQAFLKSYHERYPVVKASPSTMPADRQEIYEPPPDYSDHFDHHLNFALAVRSRKPVVEDAIFGYRAAAPALLSNTSYFENRMVDWDPAAMRIKA